ncbi:hypothetical protein EDC94DRAFT_581394 [Helicostylum pulchrum]|nr:hypothetical protein EDC94DRAFT_581394 [Helicostylum pulchrum]
MKTRNLNRSPLWNADSWLQENYKTNNGLPEIFRQGEYTSSMKNVAEEDYMFVVDKASKMERHPTYQEWALNMQKNEYRVTYQLYVIFCVIDISSPGLEFNYLAEDHLLGMNCIIDISDTSEESHMSLFGMEDQNEIKAKLTEAFCEARQPEYNCDAIKTIIRKFFKEKFTDYLHADVRLETMLFDEYLYLDSDRHTEADYIVKLFGPILENVFRESGCRLLWGESKSGVCTEAGYPAKLDLRVISRAF